MKDIRKLSSNLLGAAGIALLVIGGSAFVPSLTARATAAGVVSAQTAEKLDDASVAVSALAAPLDRGSVMLSEPIPAQDDVLNSPDQQSALIMPTRIEIPILKVDAKIEAVGPAKRVGTKAVEWGAPNNKNVGWHNYSGHLGEGKNIVLNGHNNIYGSVFKNLYTLKAGDLITLSANSVSYTYEVTTVLRLLEKGQPYEVRLKNAQYIQPSNQDRLTIISCYPPTNNTYRIVVLAKPIAKITS